MGSAGDCPGARFPAGLHPFTARRTSALHRELLRSNLSSSQLIYTEILRDPSRPHAFKAVYTVTLHGELLRTDLRIINTGHTEFDFTSALHTYIEVLDIGKAKVKGLKGLEVLDKVRLCIGVSCGDCNVCSGCVRGAGLAGQSP